MLWVGALSLPQAGGVYVTDSSGSWTAYIRKIEARCRPVATFKIATGTQQTIRTPKAGGELSNHTIIHFTDTTYTLRLVESLDYVPRNQTSTQAGELLIK